MAQGTLRKRRQKECVSEHQEVCRERVHPGNAYATRRGKGNLNKHVNVEVEIIRTKNSRQLITAGRGELAFPRDESSFGYPVQTS